LAFKDTNRLVTLPEDKVVGQKVVDVAFAAKAAVSKGMTFGIDILRDSSSYEAY
jgi:hypothetical protein